MFEGFAMWIIFLYKHRQDAKFFILSQSAELLLCIYMNSHWLSPNFRLESLNILRTKFKKEIRLDASHANETA